MSYGHWQHHLVGEFDPTEWFGFIYLIVNKDTGKQYIGKKMFTSKKSFQVKKKKKSKRVESDWREYTSSSDDVKADIEALGKDHFDFMILWLCSGKAELTYMEEKYQYQYDVIFATLPNGDRQFYNKTLGHKFYAGVAKQYAQSRAKIDAQLRSQNVIQHRS